MIKRAVAVLGLGLGLGGGAFVAHAPFSVSAHPSAVHAQHQAREAPAAETGTETTEGVSADTDAQTGDCQDSQNASGPEDSAGGGSEASAAGPDGDNVDLQQ